MNFKSISSAILLVVASFSFARAEDYSTWWQFVPKQGDGFNNALWEDPENPGTQVAPQSGNDYYVPTDKVLRTQATATFAGRTLAVSGTIRPISAGGNHTYNDLRLLDGSVYDYSTHATLSGNVRVEGSVKITPFLYGSNKYNYAATFNGDGDAVINLAMSGSAANAKTKQFDRESAYASPAYVYGDWSGFLGELRLGAWTCMQLAPGSALSYEWTCGGKVTALANSFVDLAANIKAVTLDALDLQAGAELSFNNSGETLPVLTVQSDLNLQPGSKISFKTKFKTERDSPNFANLVSHGITLFKLGEAAAAKLPAETVFEGVILENFTDFPLPGGLKPRVRENTDGSKEVVLGGTSVVLMNKNNSSNGSSEPLAFESDDCWSSGKVPSVDEDVDAVVTVASLDLRAFQSTIYPLLRLTLPSKSTLYDHAEAFEVAELTMVGGSEILSYAGSYQPKMRGILNVCPNGSSSVRLGGWGDRCYKIYSEIRGSGDLKIFYSNTSFIAAELFGTNTSYSGTITVSSDLAKQWDPTAEPPVDACATLYLNDGRNLGGTCLPEIGWKALTVENHSKVEAKDDVIVTEPTRGVYVKTAARFIVPEGKTMSFAAPITYGGELTKLGAGRLALGKAQFSATGATPIAAPTAGLNVLDVAEGSVSANDTDAFAGLAVSFAAGTSLCVDLGATDADLIATGADLRKAGTSLAVADAALKVTFCGGSAETTDGKTVAICTVPAAMAQTLKLDAEHKAETATGRMSVSVTSKTNDDGSVTYLATAFKGGVLLIVR